MTIEGDLAIRLPGGLAQENSQVRFLFSRGACTLRPSRAKKVIGSYKWCFPGIVVNRQKSSKRAFQTGGRLLKFAGSGSPALREDLSGRGDRAVGGI